MSAQELAELEERKKREEADYKKRVEEQVELMEMDDEEREQRLIEERRRRRAEIAAKFKAQPPSASAATDAAALTAVPAPEKHKVESSASAAASTGNGSAPGPPNGGGAAAGPHAEPSALAAPPAGDERAPQTEQGEQVDGAESESEEGEFPAASRVMSSDLSLEDRKKETELRAFMLAHRRQTEGGQQQSRRERAAPAAAAAALSSADTAQKTGADEEVDGGFDMFNDDVEEVTNPELMLDEAAAMDRGDNYDDKEGYYAHRVGDVLGERYKVRCPPPARPAQPLPAARRVQSAQAVHKGRSSARWHAPESGVGGRRLATRAGCTRSGGPPSWRARSVAAGSAPLFGRRRLPQRLRPRLTRSAICASRVGRASPAPRTAPRLFGPLPCDSYSVSVPTAPRCFSVLGS
jgi:hypothetical protein